MNTAASVVEQLCADENPFETLTIRERSSDRLPMPNRVAQQFAGGPSVQGSLRLHSRVRESSEFSMYPALGFTEVLRSLYASERFGLPAKLCQRLVELLSLQPGWDGESAAPPKAEVLANVVSLLVFLNATQPKFREPFLAPTIDGFAQLEWHNKERTLEFEATANGWSIVGIESSPQRKRVYRDAEATRSEIEKLILAYHWFEGAELWPII